MNHPHPDDTAAAVDADDELALAFFARFRAFERALQKAGFRKNGCLHRQGLPDWEGFACHIERRFDPHRSPILMPAVAYLLGISVRSLDDRDSLQTYPADRRFYQSNSLWLAMVIRAAGHRISSGLLFPSSRACAQSIRSAAYLVLDAWADCEPAVGKLLKDGR